MAGLFTSLRLLPVGLSLSLVLGAVKDFVGYPLFSTIDYYEEL